MFKPSSNNKETSAQAQEVVIYNHCDIESNESVNPIAATEAKAKPDESPSSKQLQSGFFSKKNMVACGVGAVGVAGIVGVGASSARAHSTQMQKNYDYAAAAVTIGQGQGGSKSGKNLQSNAGKNLHPDFSWVEGNYTCVLESGILTELGGPPGGFFRLVQDNDGATVCPSQATLEIGRQTLNPDDTWTGLTFIANFTSWLNDEFPEFGKNVTLYGVGSYNSKGDDEITFYHLYHSNVASLKLTKLVGGNVAADFYDNFDKPNMFFLNRYENTWSFLFEKLE